jgi:hypothetical protein
MKKKIFLLLIIIHSYSFGQVNLNGTSIYVLTTNFHVERGFSACNGEGGINRVFIVKNGYNIFKGPPRYNINNEFTHTYEFNKNNLVSVIQFDAESTTDAVIGCKKTDSYDKKVDLKNSTCTTIEGIFDMQNPRNIIYKFIITPKITLDTPTNNNSIISSDENISITLPDNIDNQYYNWEYSVGDINSFIPFPSQFNNVPILNLKGKDFLTDADLGKNIYIRVNMGACSTASPSTSNVIAFTYYKSAPHISSSSITTTRCFDTKDGTVTLNFDRTLLPLETLQMSLVKEGEGAVPLPNNGYITNHLQLSTSYTLQNLPSGKYKLDLFGTYNGNPTYTDSATHTISFEITKPTPVLFDSPSKTNVFCFQGNDGIINLTASGGQNQYQYWVLKDGQPFLDWTNFNNGNSTSLQNLSVGIYTIKVRDSNQCIAKDPNNSSLEKEIAVSITQPAQAIELPTSDIEIVQPTGYGLSNGYISLRVIGGTPNSDGSYNFEWRKDTPTGAVISTGITTDAVNNPYTIKLDNLTAGNYYLTVKDKNYANATSQLQNCGIILQEFIVTQPDPLIATIEVQKQISCNIANNYPYKLDLNGNGIPDEVEDGTLKTVVTGGVGAYSYQWQVFSGGTFQDILGATQSILNNSSEGTYKVLVHDINNNTTDASYIFNYPPQLAIIMSANTISCANQNTGIVSVNANGGTGSLSYEWNTMHTTPTVTGLPEGNYFVLVTDSKNCKVTGYVQIIQPNPIEIKDVLVRNPICFGASNGEIKTYISGGKAPYSISWSNGKTTADNIGISEGTYTITVTDANGCSFSKQYTLVDPAELTVDLGVDVTLCLGDTKNYDVAINDPLATYQWKDQSGNIIATSPNITLSNAGTYSVLITDSKGCTATDSVNIKNSSEVLNPQFLLATHAYVESSVVLVNTSPKQPQAVEWLIPTDNNIQIIQKTADLLELKFLSTGSYEIGLKGIQNECVKTFYKKVIVEENTSGVILNPTKASNINEFTILPNPNNGVFKVLIGLEKEQPIKIKIIDMLSHEVFPAVLQPKATYFAVPFNTALSSGVYMVILETGGEIMVKRIIIQ